VKSTKDLTELKESNKQVMSITDELKLLQNTLQSPKQRGVWASTFLQSVLDNVLPAGSLISSSYKFERRRDSRRGYFSGQGKDVAVDSKFSLENYNRLVEEKDKTRQDASHKGSQNGS